MLIQPATLAWAAPAVVTGALGCCLLARRVARRSSAAGGTNGSCGGSTTTTSKQPLLRGADEDSALAHARRLPQPQPVVKTNGVFEDWQFWDQHDELLRAAWREYGRADAAVYAFPSAPMLHPLTAAAIESDDVGALRAALVEEAPGVYALPLLSHDGCARLLAEMRRMQTSGIPCRRPNGMNRYGLILSDLGCEALLDGLCSRVAAPLGERLYPEWVGTDDCAETYGFSVSYELGGDVALAEHADTANLTLNLCLGSEGFSGGELSFKGVRFTPTEHQQEKAVVAQRPGWALLHLGGHKHAALPLTGGERTNLIVWCTGKDGVVRIRPRGGGLSGTIRTDEAEHAKYVPRPVGA